MDYQSLLINTWRFACWASRSIGRGISISSSKAWQFLCWAGPKLDRGLYISCSKTWQAICWTFSNLFRGLWLILSETFQFTCWAVPRIFRGLWFLLTTTWMVFWWIVRELLILLFNMVYGPKRALTIFVALVVLLQLWKHLWGGVRYPTLEFLIENPTYLVLTLAGILAGAADLILFYEWVKNKLSPKTNLPVRPEPELDRQYEHPKPIFRLPSKRIYSDLEKARAIVALSESQSVPSVSQQLGIPKGTLYSWKTKFQQDSRFRSQIEQVIWLVTLVKRNRGDRQYQIETKPPY